MSDDKLPDKTVIVKPQTVMCPAHGEHLRHQFPTGFAVVSMTMFREMMQDEDLIREVDPSWTSEAEHAHLDEDRLNEVLARKPMCYWVDDAGIRKAFMESGILKLGKCKLCRKRDLGGPYSFDMPTGITETWVCLSCMLGVGERLHRAHPNGGVWASR